MRRLSRPLAVGCALALGVIALLGTPVAGRLQTPTFRGGAEVIAVDVQVVDHDGQPVSDLGADKFTVTIDGRRRRVISASLIDSSTSARGVAPAASPNANVGAVPLAPLARVVILAFDCFSLDVATAREAAKAARRFIDQSPPDDQIGLFAFPIGPRLDPTTNRAALALALNTITGQKETEAGYRFDLRPSELIDMEPWAEMPGPSVDRGAQLANSICNTDADPGPTCLKRLSAEVLLRAMAYEGQAYASLGLLRGLFYGLAEMPGRKTVVLVSAGVISSDMPGARPDLDELSTQIGKAAAQANAAVYSLFLDATMATPFRTQTGRPMRNMDNLARDSAVTARFLDRFSGVAGGALVRATGGDGSLEFDRILKETSAYYLLAVEPADADRDGRVHPMQVKVNGRGLTVRGRSWVVVPTVGTALARTGAGPVDVMRGGATPVTAPPPRPLPESVRALADLFARREYAAFEDALSKTTDLANVIRDLRNSDAAWPDAPSRSAVFALELALAGLSSTNGFTRDEGVKLLAQTHAGIRQTTDAGDDFECTWYWTEAAALEGFQLPDLGLLVVTRARQRCPTHARLSLAQAVMTEQMWRRDKDSHQQQEVVARYEDARRFTETEPEARLREAWFDYTTGAADRALELLGDEPSTSPDRQVRYLHTLIKGHILEARGQLTAAASAYRQALAIWPGAQSARIGLMTTSLQLGGGAEAAGLAEDVESAEASQLDPWWMYTRGDFRAFAVIDAALREREQ